MAIKALGRSSGSRGGGSRGGSFKEPARQAVKPAQAPRAPQPSDLHQGRIQPQKPAQAAPVQRSYGTSVGGSPGGSYGGGTPGVGLSVEPAVPSEEDYLAGDATYQATVSALKKQLETFQTDVGTQRSNRKLDYDKAVKDLGYVAGVNGGENSWNWDDQLTASGRAYQNQLNDFAARGGLRSSGYAESLNNLTRSLMDQYTGIDQSNTQFNTDLDRQVTKAKDENTSASQAARAEAIMRRAAQYGFGV